MDLVEFAGARVSMTLGVDTRVAVALDGLGRRLGALSALATIEDYEALVD